MTLGAILIQMLAENPIYYVSWVFTVVVSIVLHELGHGVAALSQGDETPRLTGHMTLDPMVHMGPLSLGLLAVVGIAWGQMPVDPTRFRSRHGDAIVSFAGPLVNLLLALLGLTALGLWARWGGPVEEGTAAANFRIFLWVFGLANIVLFLLNLIPVPPLDGSRVLASFSRPYRRLLSDPAKGGLFTVAFFGVFLLAGFLVDTAREVAEAWLGLLGG